MFAEWIGQQAFQSQTTSSRIFQFQLPASAAAARFERSSANLQSELRDSRVRHINARRVTDRHDLGEHVSVHYQAGDDVFLSLIHI